MKQEDYIEIPKAWLESLQALADNCREDKDKMAMFLLIGYIDSVKVILKYNSKK